MTQTSSAADPIQHKHRHVDGATTTLAVFKAETSSESGTARPVLVCSPALGTRAGYYKVLAHVLRQRGWDVVILEWRGQGTSSVRPSRRVDFGYRQLVEQDLSDTLHEVRTLFSGRSIFLVGHSLGAQLNLLHACSHPGAVQGVVFIAGGSNYYASVPTGQLSRRAGITTVRAISQALGYFPGHRLGFGGLQPKTMMLDWTHEGLRGRYRIAGSAVDYEKCLRETELPVLFISLEGDKLIPEPCAKFLSAKLERAQVEHVLLRAKEHGLARFDHFAWAKAPAPVADALEAWLARLGG